MNALELRNVTKRFTSAGTPAVDDISFTLSNGEILALVGPSGCGKTTTLRLIAGLERPDSGSLHIKGGLVADERHFTPPEKRGVGMVFQDHALFPHMTVFENVKFGLKGQPAVHARETTLSILKLVGLENFGERYPHQLSGGERQRVALARALAPRPVLVLMDEPFSSLDADLRHEVREQVRGILKAMSATAVFVTHDQEEALYMGDRLAVFQSGRMEQVGAPEEIFHDSATRFVAEFMGDSDFLPGVVKENGIETELGLIPQKVNLPIDSTVEVALRSDDVNFDQANPANALVLARFFRGAYYQYRLRLSSGKLIHAFKPHTKTIPPGTSVHAYLSAGHELTVFQNGVSVGE
ncbi:MAG: ABC transporter ATP-binding protein [Anaerolineales bacterium]|nr:MAG: ABC transporter ATP-binding protein [Anaerolineales bacterium]